MPRVSAGLLVYRRRSRELEFLLAHPGGPFWQNRDDGAWTIPKGEVAEGEELLACALREFEEEIGPRPPGPYVSLLAIQQRGGKVVHAWACEADVDTRAIVGGRFHMQWPPRSGRWIEVPEVDRAEYFNGAIARRKINAAQIPLLDECERTARP